MLAMLMLAMLMLATLMLRLQRRRRMLVIQDGAIV